MAERGQDSSYYEVLEVSTKASREEIEASYQRIKSYLAPDALAVYSMIDEDEAVRVSSQLEEAYRTLSDHDRRAAYDKTLGSTGSTYPPVLVPEAHPGTNSTVGVVREGGRRDKSAPAGDVMDVEAIFKAESHIKSPAPPARRAFATVMDAALVEQEAASRTAEPMPRALSVTAERATVSESRRASASADPAPEPRAGASARPSPQEEPADAMSCPSSDLTSERATAAGPARAASYGAVHSGGPGSSRARRLVPSQTIEVGADTEFSGALLRRLRESCPADLETVAEITKVRKRYLAAIEEHDFAGLPAAVYIRGFVVEYARVLGLDPQRVAQSYMSLYNRYRSQGG